MNAPDSPEPNAYAKRKVPRQQRSRSTVESIQQAALLILSEEGLAHCSTERIAERAGVSIGSLYQYFPNRDAILTALYESVSIEYAGSLKSQVPELLSLPTAQAVERAIEKLLSMHERHRLVLLQLVHEVPHLRLAEQPFSFNHLTSSSTRAYLVSRLGTQRARDLDRRSFFMEQIILGCINAYLRDAPPRITRKEFMRDLCRIVTSYLGEASGHRGGTRGAQP